MLKRANKITALLVAAAAVVSLVPATAANASDRLGTKDGTITNALAYQDGKYVYEGYKSDDDDNGIYYGTGENKDKLLEDLEDANLNTPAYKDKYAYANDGSDQYLVDLSNGDVIDDDTPEDNADTAATKLKSALKKTDRYGDLTHLDAETNLGYDNTDDDSVSTGALPGNKFGDTWYSYKVEPASDADSNTDANTVAETKDGVTTNYLYGFTNQSGKYIDASNLANIYAYSTTKGKMIKIEEYSNNIDDVDDDSDLLATLVKAPVVLTQDKDYIYALVTVDITDVNANAVGTSTTTSAAAIVGDTSEYSKLTTTRRTYIQKISKSQDDKKDDAYLPKTVESYEIGNKSFEKNGHTIHEYDSSDATDAYEAISDATGVSDLTELTQDNVVYSNDGKSKPLFSIVDNKLVVVNADTDTIKATTIILKKDKVEFDDKDNLPGYKNSGESYDIDDKIDAYLAEKDDDDDVDIDVDDQDIAYDSYDFDVDGNLWAVADGKIFKFKDNEFTKVYTCDSSLDSISVYDENNLITWENDGDIYTTVNEGQKETEGEATPAQTGWVNTASGWTFYDTAGKQVVNSWVNAGGVWYMIKADGIMATGWYNDNGTWYYLNASGSMQTGWLNDNGTWYYLLSSGAMQTGWQYVNGAWYYLNGSGAMQTGWQYVNGSWYYLNGSGSMQTGWLNDNGTWYYLNSNGSMAANTTVNGYRLAASGAWI